MIRTNQSQIIAKKLDECLDAGMEDKQEIYTKIVNELGVPRPTVRRVARDFRNALEVKIRILEKEIGTGRPKTKETPKQVGY